MLFTVIGFYTLGTPYEDEVENLIDSCEDFGLMHDIRGVVNLGSWQANTQYKAEFIRDMRHELDGPLVWFDADAVVRQYPTAFDVLDGYDFAAHWRDGHELLSGTLYIGDTKPARQLLDHWCELCKAEPKKWDQKLLDKAIGQVHGLRVHTLPPAYTMIYDTMRRANPGVEPVVEHMQASRRYKDQVQCDV